MVQNLYRSELSFIQYEIIEYMNLRGHFKKWLKIWILKHAHELIAYQC